MAPTTKVRLSSLRPPSYAMAADDWVEPDGRAAMVMVAGGRAAGGAAGAAGSAAAGGAEQAAIEIPAVRAARDKVRLWKGMRVLQNTVTLALRPVICKI